MIVGIEGGDHQSRVTKQTAPRCLLTCLKEYLLQVIRGYTVWCQTVDDGADTGGPVAMLWSTAKQLIDLN